MSVKLGHFELLEQIGKGGIAAVFKAYDASLNRTVAIKLLDEELAQQDPQFVENFIHEAQSAAAINHPNIVQIYFVGEDAGNFYIAMELLEGQSLDEMIRRNGPLPEQTVLKIGAQVAGALKAAYSNQMIHGDLKPQNIFITNSGEAKLLDFGLAKMANVEGMGESDGSLWGSAYFISPERVGHKAEDFRSDIYSLGATLFNALAGHPPFDADKPEALAVKRLSEKAPALRQINPEISAKTERIVARMLEKSTFLRYLDYQSLLDDLHAVGKRNVEKTSNGTASPGNQQAATTVDFAQLLANTAEIARLATTGQIAPGLPGMSPQAPKKNRLPLMIAGAAAVLIIASGITLFALHKTEVPAPVAATGNSTPQPMTQEVQQGPVPVYRLTFDDVDAAHAKDATGHHEEAELVNLPERVSEVYGNAVHLDGSSQYVSLPADIVRGLGACTVAAWVKLDSDAAWMRVFDFGTGKNKYMFLTSREDKDGKIKFAILTDHGKGEQKITSPNVLSSGYWHHLAVTMDGRLGVLYVDGLEVAHNSSMTLTPANLGATTQNWIGKSQFPDPLLRGSVSDFRIYDCALDAEQIARLVHP